jgi:branched-chain amino acid transport system permease protein
MESVTSEIKQQRYTVPVTSVVCAGILLTIPQVLPIYGTYLLTEILIYAVFALSLNLLMGYTGLASLGHAAFFGIAAYTVAILVVKAGVGNFWVSIVVALLASAILGAIFGFLALRTSGVYFLMITLALGQMLWALAWRWTFTGGSNGLHGITRPSFGLPWASTSDRVFYYYVLFICAIAAFLIYRITISPFGRSLIGIRENESRMKALGYNTWKYKYVCFIVAAVFGGLAGVLKAYQDGSVSPGFCSVATSGIVILMVLTGGSKTFVGPIVGAAVVWLVRSTVSSYTQYWGAALGVMLVIIVMFSPEGVTPLVMKLVRKVRPRSSS